MNLFKNVVVNIKKFVTDLWNIIVGLFTMVDSF